jgi:hypothetical protein
VTDQKFEEFLVCHVLLKYDYLTCLPHSLAHRAPPATRPRIRWQSYSAVLSSVLSRSSPVSCLHSWYARTLPYIITAIICIICMRNRTSPTVSPPISSQRISTPRSSKDQICYRIGRSVKPSYEPPFPRQISNIQGRFADFSLFCRSSRKIALRNMESPGCSFGVLDVISSTSGHTYDP